MTSFLNTSFIIIKTPKNVETTPTSFSYLEKNYAQYKLWHYVSD